MIATTWRQMILSLSLLLVGTEARAQIAPEPPGAPGWVGEFTSLSGNALLGGLTAGLLQAVRGGSFRDGFARGAFGGAIAYGGKRVAVARFAGAGFLGREIAAVGASVVRNASQRRPSFGSLILPAGPLPVRLYLRPGQRTPVAIRVDAVTLVPLVYGLAEPRLRFDWGKTLSAGVPVFVGDRRVIRREGAGVSGAQVLGIVFLSDFDLLPADRNPDQTFAHERVHVLQRDFIYTTWSEPLSQWVVPRLPGGPLVHRFLSFDSVGWLPYALQEVGEREDWPWELEASFLAGR